MDEQVDVAVVGAGPGGLITAKELAKKGLDVLVLDRKQEIGAPKRCAEGLNSPVLKKLGIEPNPKWAVNEIKTATLFSPKGKQVVIEGEGYGGYIIERKIFEKHLAMHAVKAGARVMVKADVEDVILEDGKVTGVVCEHMGEKVAVKSKIVVAADGVDSMTAKKAGLKTQNRLEDYHSGFQYEMAGVKNIIEDSLHVFFGTNVAPRGYAWIFPKGESFANVGIGIHSIDSKDGERAKDYLDGFIRNNPRFFQDASPVEVNAGGIPVSSSTDTFVADGLMVVGDAAQQVNPIHGGGIALAMNAGVLAAKVAYEAISEGDTSRERLYEYERLWRETDGRRLKKLIKVRSFLEKLEDDDFEKLADIFGSDELLRIIAGDIKFIPKLMVKKAPKMIPLAKKFLT